MPHFLHLYLNKVFCSSAQFAIVQYAKKKLPNTFTTCLAKQACSRLGLFEIRPFTLPFTVVWCGVNTNGSTLDSFAGKI